jgi:uncharacterized protein (UPF0248 family)
VPKNQLRELLNKILYDSNLDRNLGFIEYKDFQGQDNRGNVPLILCAVESNNIAYGGVIIPFHRINRVAYGSIDVYPFAIDQAFRTKLFEMWGNLSLGFYVFHHDNPPPILSYQAASGSAVLKASSFATLEIKMGELSQGFYLVSAWEQIEGDNFLRATFEIQIMGRQLIYYPERHQGIEGDNLRPPSISI